MKKCKILSIRSLGTKKTYNVTMMSDQHNYAIYGSGENKNSFIISKNSHSLAYGYLSWTTAYLKANFPEEFICSYLNVETERRKMDRVQELENEVVRMGITLLPRDINKSEVSYTVVKRADKSAGIMKSEIRPSIMCKNLNVAAGENIVKNRPYNSIRELARKTDTTVDVESVSALCDAGVIKSNCEKVLKEFKIIREDMKVGKGKQAGNLFEE